jgi:RNA polymerase sigma-70 factor (ECF subfamily)
MGTELTVRAYIHEEPSHATGGEETLMQNQEGTFLGDSCHMERESIQRCQSGDISGLEALYRIYSERVFRTCYRILGDYGLAEDQTQEVFLRVFEQIQCFSGRSLFSTWLYRVTVNQTLNALRQSQRREFGIKGVPLHEQTASANPGPASELERKETREFVQAMLDSLSTEQRTVIVLREIEALSYAEIAEIIGKPVGTVMSRLHRARKELKKSMAQGNIAVEASVLKSEVRGSR